MRYWSYVLVNMCLRSIAWPLVTINHGSEHLLFTFCLVIVDRSVVQVALLKDDVDGRVSRWRRWWVSGPESNAWDIFTLTCEFGWNKMKEFWSGDQVRDWEYMSEVVVKWPACSLSTTTIQVQISLKLTVFSVKFVLEKTKINKKRSGLAH